LLAQLQTVKLTVKNRKGQIGIQLILAVLNGGYFPAFVRFDPTG
jgi:hypothetical protein